MKRIPICITVNYRIITMHKCYSNVANVVSCTDGHAGHVRQLTDVTAAGASSSGHHTSTTTTRRHWGDVIPSAFVELSQVMFNCRSFKTKY